MWKSTRAARQISSSIRPARTRSDPKLWMHRLLRRPRTHPTALGCRPGDAAHAAQGWDGLHRLALPATRSRYPSHYFNATREGLKTIFEDEGFEVELCDTFVNQTVAYTVSWVLGALNHHLPAEIRPELLNMTVGELMALDVQGEQWRRWLEALPATAREELACGNSLVAKKAA